MSIQQLVEISNYYGKDEEIVILGGGNTSYKDEKHLYVKGSGTMLSTITADGFVKMDRAKLSRMWDKTYSDDTDTREAEVLADLMDARVDKDKRPSVETALHNLFRQTYVVHTHPTVVNALTCAVDGEAWAKKLFGDSAIWLGAAMPGYVLSKITKDALEKNPDCQIILLENHGIFVAADTVDEIKVLMDKALSTIKQNINFTGADAKIAALLSAGRDSFTAKYGIFTPDHYVYRDNEKLFTDSVKIAVYAESFGGSKPMPDWLTDFIANWEVETYRKSQA